MTNNLRLFLVGQYPGDQVWRIWLSLAILSALAGLSAGAFGRVDAHAGDDAVGHAGADRRPSCSPRRSACSGSAPMRSTPRWSGSRSPSASRVQRAPPAADLGVARVAAAHLHAHRRVRRHAAAIGRLERVGRAAADRPAGARRHRPVVPARRRPRPRPAQQPAGDAHPVDRLHRADPRRAAGHDPVHGRHHPAPLPARGVAPRPGGAGDGRHHPLLGGLRRGERARRAAGHSDRPDRGGEGARAVDLPYEPSTSSCPRPCGRSSPPTSACSSACSRTRPS